MEAVIDPASDLHLHTRYSDGNAGVREMIEAAVARGFRRIAITDHMPLPFESRYAMAVEEIDRYREEIRRVRGEYAGVIEVRLGLEMEYLPGFEVWTEKIAAAGWEHAIGSVHGIIADGRRGMVNGTRTEFERLLSALFNGDIRALCTHYYKHLQRVVDSGLVSTVGHLDVLKKHNRDGIFFDETAAWYCDLVMETLNHVKASSMTVEINMSGCDHPTAAPYPSPWLVAECIRRDIPLVLSSDAHRPENIGRNFERLPDMLCPASADWGRCPSSEEKIPPESSLPY
ncbi:histidinol-phosphatase [Desulfococcus sp.]|uniref:histidinol-phosphatase n=1 Tax=Desulfococcus sp. TaxID=2025834 RepID=UPI003593D063